MRPIYLPGLFDPAAADAVRQHGHTPEAAAQQAEAVFDRLDATLATAGGMATDVCKITMQITNRAYRQAI